MQYFLACDLGYFTKMAMPWGAYPIRLNLWVSIITGFNSMAQFVLVSTMLI
jgi:hypothetical protein